MGQALPEAARELFDGPHLVTVATINPDGAPQTSIVWAKADGDDIVFSTVKGRRKHANLERDPRASLLTVDPAVPYVYAEVRGRVTLTDDPGGSLLQELARLYTGRESWPDDAPDRRVIVRIVPEKVVVY